MGEKGCPVIWLRIHAIRDLLHASHLRHGTDGFTSPPKGGVLRIFSPLKSVNLGTKAQQAIPRPPKPLSELYDIEET